MTNKTSRHFSIAMFVSLSAFAPSVFAYLDPSTGSMILSAIIGIFATLTLAIKTYWYKLKSFFSGSKNSRNTGGANSGEEKDAG
jgi:hypothetical protein